MYERQRDTSYLTLPNTQKSRSLNHYYNQANQFQKRYQNSIYGNYRLKKKCPPCCEPEQNQNNCIPYSSNTTTTMFKTGNINNTSNRSNYQANSPYQDDSQTYIKNQIKNLQNSKRFLEELVQKNKLEYKIKLEKSQNQLELLTSNLQRKNDQITELTNQISKLKKMSFYNNENQYSLSSSPKKTLSKETHSLQIAAKQQIIKQLQRKVSQLNEQNLYLEEDVQLKSQQILQLKSKGKLLQEKQQSLMKSYQNQIEELKQNTKNFLQRISLYQSKTKEKDKKINQLQKKIEQLSDKQDRNLVRFKEYQIIVSRQREQKQRQEMQKNMYQNQLKKFQLQFSLLQRKYRDRDMFVDQLQSRISCLQSQIKFFKDKFQRLLYQLEKEQAESMTMIQQATILKEKGEKIYEQIQKIRQSQIYQRDSNINFQSSDINFNLPDHSQIKDKIEGKITQSKFFNRSKFGYESSGPGFAGFGSPQKYQTGNKNVGLYYKDYNNYDILEQSKYESRHRQLTSLPSMTMSISPIRHN